jgi:hypothetical protein
MGKSPNSNLLIEIFALVILTSYLIILFFIILITSRKFALLFDTVKNYETFVSRKLSTYLLGIKVLTFILSIGLNIISIYILSSNNYITSGWIFLIMIVLLCIYLMIFTIERHFYKKSKLDMTSNPFRYCIIAILALITCSLALFFGTYSKYIHIGRISFTNDTIIQQIIWCLAIIDIIALCYCIIYITNEIRRITNKNIIITDKDPFEGFYFGGEYVDQVINRIEDFRDSGGWSIL